MILWDSPFHTYSHFQSHLIFLPQTPTQYSVLLHCGCILAMLQVAVRSVTCLCTQCEVSQLFMHTMVIPFFLPPDQSNLVVSMLVQFLGGLINTHDYFHRSVTELVKVTTTANLDLVIIQNCGQANRCGQIGPEKSDESISFGALYMVVPAELNLNKVYFAATGRLSDTWKAVELIHPFFFFFFCWANLENHTSCSLLNQQHTAAETAFDWSRKKLSLNTNPAWLISVYSEGCHVFSSECPVFLCFSHGFNDSWEENSREPYNQSIWSVKSSCVLEWTVV